jgi:aldehyde:ferredoxin oxidoreductase
MRGADHLYALSNVRNIHPQEATELFGTEKASDPRLPDGKGKVVKWFEEGMTLADIIGSCKLAIHTYAANATEIIYRRSVAIPKLYKAITGREVGYEELVRIAMRLTSLEKAYNMREKWIGRREDSMPQRFLLEPMPSGPCQGNLYEQDQLLDEYYEAKGWDKLTGQPTREALEELGLLKVAEELSKYGPLPTRAPVSDQI